MGPALIPILGVKGGTGSTVISAIIARFLSRQEDTRICLVDGSSPPYSLLPHYLSIPSPLHSLSQLSPYREQVSQDLVEGYFSKSPEGVVYAPIRQQGDPPMGAAEVLSLLDRFTGIYGRILADLSSCPEGVLLPFLEASPWTLLVSSQDPGSLKALRQWGARIRSLHLPLDRFGLLLNHNSPPSSPFSKPDLGDLADRLLGTFPYGGGDLPVQLSGPDLPGDLERSLGPILEKFPRPGGKGEKKTPPGGEAEGPGPAPRPWVDPEFLEGVHRLHQGLLEGSRRSWQGKGAGDGDHFSDPRDPQTHDLLNRSIQDLGPMDRDLKRLLFEGTMDLAFGLGPLEKLIQDDTISEIMVNGHRAIYVERDGKVERTPLRFFDEAQLRTIIERILAPLGRRIDESQPYADGRLPDGSRVNAVLPPLSLDGPVLTIRKFSRKELSMADLVRMGSLTQESADFLGACVRARKNIVVSGGTGSGKTTLLNSLSSSIPRGERIITIEDSAELRLSQDHVLRLESRPPNLEGKGRVSIRDLVANALRMRPDRIVVGECRGGEALDMLQAMNTGHEGSLTTVHSNSPRDALARLETLALFAEADLPLRAVREQIARAVHLVVQQSRLPGGKRAVTRITEVQGIQGEVILTQDLFEREEGTLVRRSFAPSFQGFLSEVGYEWPGYEGGKAAGSGPKRTGGTV